MNPQAPPRTLYALTLEPESPAPREKARLVHASSGGRDHVVVFFTETHAKQWAEKYMSSNTVLRPFALVGKAEIVAFLNSLAGNGDTHVCINPTERVGGIAEITRVVEWLGGVD